MLIALTVVFCFGFQCGPGPIVWLYLSEICNNSATSVNTVVNWGWMCYVSITTPIIANVLGGWMWLMFMCTSFIGLIYLYLVMKETRGLPKEQLKTLYYKQNLQRVAPK